MPESKSNHIARSILLYFLLGFMLLVLLVFVWNGLVTYGGHHEGEHLQEGLEEMMKK